MADITTSDIREGSVEGYLACVTDKARGGERDLDSSLFLRYSERWSGMRDADGGATTHSDSWRTVSLVFGHARVLESNDRNVRNLREVVACESLSIKLFRDFVGRAHEFLVTYAPEDRVPGTIEYVADGFRILVAREEADLEHNSVSVCLHNQELAQSASVYVSADRVAGFFAQVSIALESLRGGESSITTTRRRRN